MHSPEGTPAQKRSSTLDETEIEEESEEPVGQGSEARAVRTKVEENPEVDSVKVELRHAIQSRRVAQGLPPGILGSESKDQQDDNLSPEEQRRRQLRRERNRVAALRCREKRKERANALRKEADSFEEQNNNLEEDITLLRKEKERLSLMLDVHHCLMPGRLRTEHAPTTAK